MEEGRREGGEGGDRGEGRLGQCSTELGLLKG